MTAFALKRVNIPYYCLQTLSTVELMEVATFCASEMSLIVYVAVGFFCHVRWTYVSKAIYIHNQLNKHISL